MIDIFDLIIKLTILLILLVTFVGKRRKIIDKLEDFVYKWIRMVGLFLAVLLVIYAIDLRHNFEDLKYDEMTPNGYPVEKYKADNKIVFEKHCSYDGTCTIIDTNGSYKKFEDRNNKLWRMVGLGYLIFLIYFIINRKNIIIKVRNSKLWRVWKQIQLKKREEEKYIPVEKIGENADDKNKKK